MIQFRSVLDRGHTGSLLSAAALSPPCTPSTQTGVSLTQDELGISQIVIRRQDRLRWPDAWHGQTSILTSQHATGLFYPLMLLFFPCFFLPQSPKSIPSPTLGSCPEYPIISPVQIQNALPLHPLTCPAPLGNDPSPKDAPALTPPHGCHLWPLGLRVPWVSPGTVWTGWLIRSAHPSFGFPSPAFVSSGLLGLWRWAWWADSSRHGPGGS